MNAPAVSVVVPVLNGMQTIGLLLNALRGQRPLETGYAEFIVVDNGSTDGTRAILEGAAIPNLRVVDEPRRGASAARNRGLAEARAEIVALLDADSVPTRPWLREISAPFADRDVLLVAGATASFPPRTAAQRFAARYGLNDARRCLEMRVMPFANTRNMAVRRSVAVSIGGWNEEMRTLEDVEFSHSVRERYGCDIAFRESALAFHFDREDDEGLRRQAIGYGHGTAVMYARYPEMLRWGSRQRLLRTRRSALRRLDGIVSSITERLRLTDREKTEFAQYLALWDRWYWDGFDRGRRELAS